MKKVYLMAICLFISITCIQAQKVTGSLNFLKEVEKLHFQFEHKQPMTEKEDEEKEYVQNVFLKDFNAETVGKGLSLEGGYFPDAEYIATVKTLWLEPGYIAGPFTKPAEVTVEIVITKSGSSKELSRILVKQAKGSLSDVTHTYATEARRIASSYGEAGEKLGKKVAKALKK
ncbi:MAG: hypothetical protein LBH92_00075 [Bacteroidales bacterium]|jgi:hypothetical protein|nr:hypothetical protein [Bacteroidales bacterium]